MKTLARFLASLQGGAQPHLKKTRTNREVYQVVSLRGGRLPLLRPDHLLSSGPHRPSLVLLHRDGATSSTKRSAPLGIPVLLELPVHHLLPEEMV